MLVSCDGPVGTVRRALWISSLGWRILLRIRQDDAKGSERARDKPALQLKYQRQRQCQYSRRVRWITSLGKLNAFAFNALRLFSVLSVYFIARIMVGIDGQAQGQGYEFAPSSGCGKPAGIYSICQPRGCYGMILHIITTYF